MLTGQLKIFLPYSKLFPLCIYQASIVPHKVTSIEDSPWKTHDIPTLLGQWLNYRSALADLLVGSRTWSEKADYNGCLPSLFALFWLCCLWPPWHNPSQSCSAMLIFVLQPTMDCKHKSKFISFLFRGGYSVLFLSDGKVKKTA